VLAQVVRGQLNKQIAGDLEASERTIKAHRANSHGQATSAIGGGACEDGAGGGIQ